MYLFGQINPELKTARIWCARYMDRHLGMDYTLACTHPLNPTGNLFKEISKIKVRRK